MMLKVMDWLFHRFVCGYWGLFVFEGRQVGYVLGLREADT